MKSFAIVILLFIVENTCGQGLLDGKTYTITLKVSGAKRTGISWSNDELSFKGATFTSKFMGKQENFSPFEFTSRNDTTDKGTIDFTATGENPAGSTIVWEGKVTGDKIEGVATWTNFHGPQKQVFNGSLK